MFGLVLPRMNAAFHVWRKPWLSQISFYCKDDHKTLMFHDQNLPTIIWVAVKRILPQTFMRKGNRCSNLKGNIVLKTIW